MAGTMRRTPRSEDAARRANAHEFIGRLPDRYETFVGERGVKLSGGQQQRSRLRAPILKSPQILILDEATSNLDTESEQLIQASMAPCWPGGRRSSSRTGCRRFGGRT
jgi:ABC-type multidrug transport system fused ATPase/permease subunit